MEKDLRIINLYDIYGKLLTKKQQEIFNEYYLYDLSLREIAENKNISYQAVRDSLKKSKEMLENYDDVIHMAELLENNLKLQKMCKDEEIDLNQKRNEILNLLVKKSEDDI